MKEMLGFRKNVPVRVTHSHNPFLTVQNELNRAMGDFYGWFDDFNFPAERFEGLKMSPAIDIIDDKEHFKAEIEVPGMGEEDLKVSIDDGLLMVRGEKTTSKKDKGKNYRMREISYGSYERHIPLPDTVDVDNAKASFKKGMLWVTIPKKAESTKKSREIEVKTA